MTESRKKDWVDKPRSARGSLVRDVRKKRLRPAPISPVGDPARPPTQSAPTGPAAAHTAEYTTKLSFLRWGIGLVAAAAAIYFYLSELNDMMALAMDPELNETTWARAQWLFQGIEAIAFAAAGLLFGVVVERRYTQRAEHRESEADEKRQKAESAHLMARERAFNALVLLEQRRQFSESAGPDQALSLIREIAENRLN